MTDLRSRAVAFAAVLLACASLRAASPAILPGLQHDGSVLLPNQWSLRPAGRQVIVGDFPVNLAVHPSGRFVAVLHSGYSQHEVRILEIPSGKPVSQAALEETFYGLAWSPDGRHLYAPAAPRSRRSTRSRSPTVISANTASCACVPSAKAVFPSASRRAPTVAPSMFAKAGGRP